MKCDAVARQQPARRSQNNAHVQKALTPES